MKKPNPKKFQAQDLAYDAMEAKSDEQMVKLCKQALKIYPDCVDAQTMLATR